MNNRDHATDRRALEARLEESDRIWRSLVESSPDVIMILGIDGTVSFVNRVGAPYEGRTVVGEKIWAFATESGAEQLVAALRHIVETRESMRYVSEGLRGDGSLGWYEVRMLPLALDGIVERILFTASDVTERKLDAEKIAASEHRFRALVEHGVDCIALIDESGRFTYVSPATRPTLGYEPEELIGTVALDMAHPDDRPKAADEQTVPRSGRKGSPKPSDRARGEREGDGSRLGRSRCAAASLRAGVFVCCSRSHARRRRVSVS